MTILVTGGAGFIGSHLVERLLSNSHDVRIVDNLSSNPIPLAELKDEIKAAYPDYPTIIQHLEVSIMSVESFRNRGSGGQRLDGIYHLASPVGPAGILPYAGYIVNYIVNSTYDIIDLALRHKCRLVYVSTSEIYGGGVDGLCSEDTPCVVPISHPTARLEYAIGKLAGEIAVLNTPGLDAVIIRPFNVAGPRQSDKGGFVLPRFVKQALDHEPLTIFGDGTQIRAFTHVSDIVDGLLLAMDKGVSKQAYNLGNPANKTTILELATSVVWNVNIATLGYGGWHKDNIKFTDGKQVYGPAYSEANDKFPNANKAMVELGWEPKYSMLDIIDDVIAYERSKAHVD
jgi:UDP-glucose 4-epimerase